MNARFFILLLAALTTHAMAGPFAPAAGVAGTTALWKNDPLILGWATDFRNLTRGSYDLSDPFADPVSWGLGSDALGVANAEIDSMPVLSLGDGGRITLTFAEPIGDGPGADFAVFENAFTDNFLELAFVEVSSDGVNFHRFPAQSLTQSASQVGGFSLIDPTDLHNLAGKYRRGYGTPFDLADLAGVVGLDMQSVTQVRVVDVVGAISDIGTKDSQGRPINDPFPTPYETGGFDLDAVAVLHWGIAVPEPSSALLLFAGAALLARRRR